MEAILQLGSEHVSPALSDAAMGVMNFLNQVAMQFPQAISFAPGRLAEEHFAISATLPYIERFVRGGRSDTASQGWTPRHRLARPIRANEWHHRRADRPDAAARREHPRFGK